MKITTLAIFALLLSFTSSATIGRIFGDTIVCIGSPITFFDTTTGGLWSISDTSIATIDTFGSVEGISAGIATITYSVGSGFVIQTIKVCNAPAPITGPSGSFCTMSSIALYNTTPGGGHWYANWPMDISSSTADSATVIAYAGGYGNIYFIDTNGCKTGVIVIAYPFTGINFNDTSVYVDSTIDFAPHLIAAGAGYSTWSSSDTSVATIDSSTGVATGVSPGITTITLSNGCIATTTLTVLSPSGVPVYSATKGGEISISPNPATTQLNISAKDEITTVAISNLLGQTVYNHPYNSTQVSVDVADLPAGIYLIRINNTEVMKFVKQ